jgi:hypothetical protein
VTVKKVMPRQLGVGGIPMDDTHTYIVDEKGRFEITCVSKREFQSRKKTYKLNY